MKILLLHNGYRAQDESTRLNFIKTIVKRNNCCAIVVYGPKENELNSKLAPVPYDRKITAKDIIDIFEPDVILSYLHTPGCCNWFPKDMNKVKVPLVIIEQDHYFYNKPEDKEVLDWYKDTNVSLVMRRHYYEEECTVPSVYTPPSVDSSKFYKDDNVKKVKKIGFAVSYERDCEYYKVRRLAMGILLNYKLLDENYGRIYNGYPEFLRSHVGMLSCSGGPLHTVLQKTFEIMLSGSIVLTSFMNCSNLLFNNKPVGLIYRDDCTDLINMARYVINEFDNLKEISNNAISLVTEKHTDIVRAKEVYTILESLISGKEIPRIWGQ